MDRLRETVEADKLPTIANMDNGVKRWGPMAATAGLSAIQSSVGAHNSTIGEMITQNPEGLQDMGSIAAGAQEVEVGVSIGHENQGGSMRRDSIPCGMSSINNYGVSGNGYGNNMSAVNLNGYGPSRMMSANNELQGDRQLAVKGMSAYQGPYTGIQGNGQSAMGGAFKRFSSDSRRHDAGSKIVITTTVETGRSSRGVSQVPVQVPYVQAPAMQVATGQAPAFGTMQIPNTSMQGQAIGSMQVPTAVQVMTGQAAGMQMPTAALQVPSIPAAFPAASIPAALPAALPAASIPAALPAAFPAAFPAAPMQSMQVPTASVMPTTSVQVPMSISGVQATGMQVPSTGTQLPAMQMPMTGLATGIQMPAASMQMPAASMLPAAPMQMPAASMQMPAASMLPAAPMQMPAMQAATQAHSAISPAAALPMMPMVAFQQASATAPAAQAMQYAAPSMQVAGLPMSFLGQAQALYRAPSAGLTGGMPGDWLVAYRSSHRSKRHRVRKPEVMSRLPSLATFGSADVSGSGYRTGTGSTGTGSYSTGMYSTGTASSSSGGGGNFSSGTLSL